MTLAKTEEKPKELDELYKIIRVFQGLPPESDTAISQLINMKSLLERSRFPTYPLIARQVYLRLLNWYYGDMAEACKMWADYEAEALIEYKGQGRQEFVEINKAAQQAQQEFYISPEKQKVVADQAKGHWWQRGKKEESEFEAK